MQLTPLDDFVAVESDVAVTTLGCHGPRLALGMDLASGIVVRELLRDTDTAGVHVLDFCCAPGSKLLYAAELCASVTGVDVAKDRLDSVKAHVRRLRLPNVRVACADATTFIPSPPSADAALVGAIHPSCWKARLLLHAEERARRAESRGEAAEVDALRRARVEGGGRGQWERVSAPGTAPSSPTRPAFRLTTRYSAPGPGPGPGPGGRCSWTPSAPPMPRCRTSAACWRCRPRGPRRSFSRTGGSEARRATAARAVPSSRPSRCSAN